MMGIRTVRRAGRSATLVAGLVVVFALAAASSAYAATSFSAQKPTPGSTVSVLRPAVSVDVSDPTGLKGKPYFSMKVDGAAQSPTFTYLTTDKRTARITWTSTRDLSVGSHTILVSAANTAGKYTSTQWTFVIATPITFADLAPSGTATTLTPTISARVASGGTLSSWNLRVDGTSVPSLYNSVTGVVSYKPVSPLANGALHSVSLDATGTSLLAASTSWQFFIQIYPQMPGDASVCTDCHLGFPAAHPMTDCLGCHGAGSPVGEGWNVPDLAHSSSYIADTPCASCHQGYYYPAVPTMHATDVAIYHVTPTATCTPCHERSLTVEHYRRNASFTCATCHSSTVPLVQSAIANGDTNCSACHQFGSTGHPFIPSVHESTIAAQTLSGSYPSGASYAVGCATCHQTGVKEEHETRATLPGGDVCAVCHPTPRDTLTGGWNKSCVQGGCHVAGSATEQHSQMTLKHAAPVSDASCVGCHTKGGASGDVGAIHSLASTTTAGVTRTSCAVCHDATTLPTTTDCVKCHPDRVNPHGYDVVKHTSTVVPANITINGVSYGPYSCSDCHGLELAPEHAKPTSSSSAAGCDACHPTRVAQLPPPWDKSTCAQGNCHTVTSLAPQHGQVDSDHQPLSANAGCFSAECHAVGSDLAALHSNATTTVAGVTRTSCAVCHSSGVPATKDCTACHPPAHDLSMHTTLPQNDGCFGGAGCHAPARLDELHSQATTTVAGVTHTSCMVCHATGTPSSKDCTTCHTTQGTDYHVDMDAKHLSPTTSTCFGAGCHDASQSLPAVHELYVGPGSRYPSYATTCALCHQNSNPNRIDWANATAACTGVCHSSPEHADYATRHALTAASDDCTPCHGTDIATIHGATADSSKCATCHSDPANWSKTADCVSCHAGKFPPATNHYPPAIHTGTDTGAGDQNCSDCHNLELAPEHAKTSSGSISCVGCHTSAKFTSMARPWNDSCAACHAVRHDSIEASHAPLPANAQCTGSGCHTTGLGGIHSSASTTTAGVTRTSCQICHYGGTIPTVKNCLTCHPEKVDGNGDVVGHGFDVAKHTASISASTFSGTLPYSYDVGSARTMTFAIGCTQCHLANIYDEHQKNPATAAQGCGLCHASPRNSFTTWNKGCQQGGCHAGTIHTQMNARHAPAYNSCGGGSSDCHMNPGWGVMDGAGAHNDYWYWQQIGANNYSFPPLPPYGCATCHKNATTVPTVTTCATCHDSSAGWEHP